jgi:hypothetical protein
MKRDPGDENLAETAGLPFEEMDQIIASFATRQRVAAAALGLRGPEGELACARDLSRPA